MIVDELQEQCELGQADLMRTNYLRAERILAEAERQAWEQRDFDTLSRLYMPLQEARRQRRQRCGEGEVCMDLLAESESDMLDGQQVVENYPFGQLLVGGWGSIAPAIAVRRLAREHSLYIETFLAAVYPITSGQVIAIIPLESDHLPPPTPRGLDQLRAMLPRHALILREHELPTGSRRGNAETFSMVMGLWERLAAPFLSAANAELDPLRRIERYRQVIDVDFACELAHQEIAAAARDLGSV